MNFGNCSLCCIQNRKKRSYLNFLFHALTLLSGMYISTYFEKCSFSSRRCWSNQIKCKWSLRYPNQVFTILPEFCTPNQEWFSDVFLILNWFMQFIWCSQWCSIKQFCWKLLRKVRCEVCDIILNFGGLRFSIIMWLFCNTV